MPSIEQIKVNNVTYDIRDTSKASPSSVVNVTATSGSWSNATNPSQTISASGVKSNNNIIVTISSNATSAQLDAYISAKILCTSQGTNSITLTAYGNKPTTNIPFSVLILS